jgi:hypothetical protein
VKQLAAHPVSTGSLGNTASRTHAFSRSCRHCGSSMPVRTAGDQLLADYLDYMRRNAGDERTPHVSAHQEYCTRRNLPEVAADRLWQRWLRHYLAFGRG